jgi:putative membrane protein insertion efficiency factor
MSAGEDGRFEPAALDIPVARHEGPTVLARVLIAAVTGYRRFVSPLLPPRCRFEPSCSAYALGALREHGAVRGVWLAVRRVARCHPFNPGGYDPVPPRRTSGKPGRARAWAGPLFTEKQGS